MKRRPSREISVFNLSMLDVIFSALGAILILYVIAAQTNEKHKSESDQLAAMLEQIVASQAAVQQAQDRIAQLTEQARKAKSEAERAKIEARRAKAAEEAAKAGVLGMCNPATSTVTISLWDHVSTDDDQVRVSFDGVVLWERLSLQGYDARAHRQLELPPGASYLKVEALTEGANPPNTALILVDPCDGQSPLDFKWEMQTGQERHISFLR